MRTTPLSRYFWTALLLAFLFQPTANGRSRKKKPTAPPQFAYYLLVLSYAPNFCDQPRGEKDPRECGTGLGVGFVVHGLWPQGEKSRGPQNCRSASGVTPEIVEATLNYVPTESLIRHEWAAHGTCSGLSAGDYFTLLRKARDTVTVPPEVGHSSQKLQLSPAEFESRIAAANTAFPKTAFRTACYRNNELQELRVCFGKDLSPRPCGASAGQCSAATITLLPVR